MKALPSVNLHAETDAPATIVRSDVCVVPAAAIVGEAMVRLALMAPVLEKYGGDSMEETLDNLRPAARTRPPASSRETRSGRDVKRHVAWPASWPRENRRSAESSRESSAAISSIPTRWSSGRTGPLQRSLP